MRSGEWETHTIVTTREAWIVVCRALARVEREHGSLHANRGIRLGMLVELLAADYLAGPGDPGEAQCAALVSEHPPW